MKQLLSMVATTLVCLLGSASVVHAQEFGGAVACGTKDPAEFRVLTDGSLYASQSEFGTIDQSILAASLSRSYCDGTRNGRWRFEGSLARVDQPGGDTSSLLVGAGYQFAIGERASITPMVRIGYASVRGGDDQTVASVGVSFVSTTILNEEANRQATWLTFEAVPEYSSWQSTDAGFQGLTLDDGVFTNFAAVGLDFPMGVSNYRGRARIGHRYIDSDGPTRSITSVILSVRRDPARTMCEGQCWSADLWLSQGDGDYSSVLIGFSRPFGR